MNSPDPRIIVALDFADPAEAMTLVDRLDPGACALKVGKELFVVAGPEPVRRMIDRGFRMFLDLKFHDIPNTVAQGIRVLRSFEDQYPSLDLLNALFNLVLAQEGAEPAAQLIKDELVRNPTLLGLDKLLEAQLLAAPAERRHDLELVKGLVGQHIKRLGMYRCEQCGFRAKQYYWRCPGCGKWETYTPRRTETPDGYV